MQHIRIACWLHIDQPNESFLKMSGRDGSPSKLHFFSHDRVRSADFNVLWSNSFCFCVECLRKN